MHVHVHVFCFLACLKHSCCLQERPGHQLFLARIFDGMFILEWNINSSIKKNQIFSISAPITVLVGTAKVYSLESQLWKLLEFLHMIKY